MERMLEMMLTLCQDVQRREDKRDKEKKENLERERGKNGRKEVER